MLRDADAADAADAKVPLTTEEMQHLRSLAPELAHAAVLGTCVVVPESQGDTGWACSAASVRRFLALAAREPLGPKTYVRFCDTTDLVGATGGERRQLRRAAKAARWTTPDYLEAPGCGPCQWFALTQSTIVAERSFRGDTRPMGVTAPSGEPSIRLVALCALSSCWREGSAQPGGVAPPQLAVDGATLRFCGTVLQARLLAVPLALQTEAGVDYLDDLLRLTDAWEKGLPGEPCLPGMVPHAATLRFCGGVVREAVLGLLEEVVQAVQAEDAKEEPSPTVPDYAERAVRGLALYLWRVWTLVTALCQDPPPALALEDLWQTIDHQIQRTADRILRAAERTGRCAVQEGCGRAHETVASAPPDPDAFQGLIAQLAALGAAWQDGPPVSHRAAGDALASLLREHGALHEQGAPGLCAACRPILLGFLRDQPSKAVA